MEYKNIILNSEETYYRIYKDGRLMNEKTGCFYKGTIRGGYRWFDLRWKNKKHSVSQHRLLALYFIDNPDNLEYVHHIDNNRLNNNLSNLQWISPSENNLSINRKIAYKDHRDYHEYDISKEQWKTFRNTVYMVSNLGRLKNAKTDKILQGKITDSGYRTYNLSYDHKKHTLFAHKIVWEVWVGDKQKVINHINGNKLDNRIENLENITSQENNLKAIYETKIHTFEMTACYDQEGNLIQIFENNADAARKMKVAIQSIWYAVEKGTKSCGYYWKHIKRV